MSRARELFRRIGTPDAVSWPAFWVSFVANALITFSTGFDVGATLGDRVVVLLATQAACFAWLIAFRQIVLRNAWVRPRPAASLVAFAITGIIRGVVASAVFVALLGASWSVLPWRAISGAIGCVVIFSAVAVVVSTARDYRRVRADLLDRREQLTAARERVVETIEARDERVVSRIESELSEALVAADPGQRADRLESLAADVVRPLSHDLAKSIPSWEPPPAQGGRIRFAAILDRAASGRPLLPVTMGICLAAIYAALLGNEFGWPLALAYVALDVALGIGVLWLANRMLGRLLSSGSLAVRLTIVIATVAAAGAIVGAAIQIAVSGHDYRLPLALSSAFFFCCFGLPIVVARAALDELDVNLADLQEVDAELTWRVKRLQMIQWSQQRGTARALHGPVQSAIAAAAQRLRSSDHLDAGELRSQLMGLLETGAEPGDSTWTSGISRTMATWDGLCHVEVQASSSASAGLHSDHVCAEIAVEIVAEAVSNAVRHGHAQLVEVTVWETSQSVELVITDDGAGEAGFQVGLGTRLLEDCALAWSRGVTEGRMTLAASLPMDIPR